MADRLSVDDLSSDQRVMFDAMDSFVRSGNYAGSPILRAGGFAGSGKTTVLGVFAAHAQKLGKTIAYVAFTGRASSVLGRSLRAAGVQLTTKPRKDDEDHESRWWDSSIEKRTGGPAFCGTIHRLIYKPIINAREELCGWNHRELLDRDYDVIVVDEASMVGEEMLLDLQAFGAPILAVGDHGQLPPVRQAGSLMKDPDIKLETIHRQAEGNPIIALSRHVREGGYLAKFKTSDPRVSFRYKRDLDAVLKDAYGKSERAIDVGILCWTNRQRIALNMAARKTLGRRGAPQSGEVVIWLRNSPPIFNGMRGVLTRDSFPGYKPWHLDTMIEFAEEGLPPCAFILCAAQFNRERVFENVDELRERGIIVDEMSRAGKYADFGYALTTHKSQGSQFEHTIVFMDMPEKPHDENYRRWAYTSITRSADRLSVLAR